MSKKSSTFGRFMEWGHYAPMKIHRKHKINLYSMNTFVRTNHTTHPLLKISKMVAVLLLIFVPFTATANPNFKSSSNGYATPTSVGAQSYQYEPISYQVNSTSSYSFSSTYSPAQTVYTPFSSDAPGSSNDGSNGPARIYNRKNGFVDSGEHGREESPIGEPWILLAFAAAAAGVVYIKRRSATKKSRSC
jgi:hypothetical protein